MNPKLLPIIIACLVVLAVGGALLFRDSGEQSTSQTDMDHDVPPQAGAGEVSNSDVLAGANAQLIIANAVNYHGTAKGFYAAPKAAGTYPGVVMIHEWWGLNDNVKDMARNLAKEGYHVLAVDLYNGAVATTREEAQTLTGSLNKEDAVINMKAAIAYLKTKNASKVASLGWCFGGGKSLELALSGQKLDATVIYYGTLVTDAAKLSAIKWPVLGIFGEKDTSIPALTINQFEKNLIGFGVKNEIYIYPGVGHAFANPSGQSYAPEETKDAWAKTLKFLEESLKSTATPAPAQQPTTPAVKEFTMTSFFEMKDGQPSAQFSLKEINVKKGDRVRIKVTNTRGIHDFSLDEYGVKKETPLNEETVIEFTADKTGEFVYYCSMPNHRAMGQWGTFRVAE